MPTLPHISNPEARRPLLYAQGLSFTPLQQLPLSGPLELIEFLGFAQVDSINTVARAHHMILFARNHTYRQQQLPSCWSTSGPCSRIGHTPPPSFRCSFITTGSRVLCASRSVYGLLAQVLGTDVPVEGRHLQA